MISSSCCLKNNYFNLNYISISFNFSLLDSKHLRGPCFLSVPLLLLSILLEVNEMSFLFCSCDSLWILHFNDIITIIIIIYLNLVYFYRTQSLVLKYAFIKLTDTFIRCPLFTQQIFGFSFQFCRDGNTKVSKFSCVIRLELIDIKTEKKKTVRLACTYLSPPAVHLLCSISTERVKDFL